jgi:FHS family Na+ dependent glucose MFS transporter 1
MGLVAASLGPALPSLAEHTHTHLSAVSLLFTAYRIGYLISSFQGGRLYDRLPGHALLVAVVVSMAAAAAFIPLSSSLWLLAIAVLLMGASAGMVEIGGNTLLVWLYRDRVGPFMNGLHFAFGVGAFLSPIVIHQASSIGGDIAWSFWALAALILPAAVWVALLPGPPAHVAGGDGRVARAYLGVVLLMALLLFLYVGAEVSLGGWIFTYTLEMGLTQAASAAYLTSAFWGSLTLGRLLAIPMAARFRPRTMLLADFLGSLAAIGVILLWPRSLVAVWLGTLGVGLSMASIIPTLLSLAGRHMPITGQVTGWFFVGAGAGGMTLPWLIGQLFETLGPRIAMVILLVDLALALAVFSRLILRLSQPVTPDQS